MIEYKGKDYTELNFNECIEFEKELLKKVLAANRAGMGDDLIQQLNVFIDLLRDQKAEAIRKEMKHPNLHVRRIQKKKLIIVMEFSVGVPKENREMF